MRVLEKTPDRMSDIYSRTELEEGSYATCWSFSSVVISSVLSVQREIKSNAQVSRNKAHSWVGPFLFCRLLSLSCFLISFSFHIFSISEQASLYPYCQSRAVHDCTVWNVLPWISSQTIIKLKRDSKFHLWHTSSLSPNRTKAFSTGYRCLDLQTQNRPVITSQDVMCRFQHDFNQVLE